MIRRKPNDVVYLPNYTMPIVVGKKGVLLLGSITCRTVELYENCIFNVYIIIILYDDQHHT